MKQWINEVVCESKGTWKLSFENVKIELKTNKNDNSKIEWVVIETKEHEIFKMIDKVSGEPSGFAFIKNEETK